MAASGKNGEEIFYEALEIQDPAKRVAYLDEACRQDNELRARVDALLKAHERAGSFLDAPADAGEISDSRPRIEGPGTVIGRYELLELIGEGGMGLVYLAEQKEPVRRQVAFKIIKPGMDSKQVIARFEAERQALAVLDHPNIAHVFDAGCTETGRPYFVMEYVKGMSITHYCDENKLTIEQRLRLFEQVCEDVHHAHQKGIIHRDIKPSNILVSVHDDQVTPKIIDFGIAKAITSPLTDKTFATLQGQLLGTPEYMSPEQMDLATQDVDTRSDIYSLGVVLYELLAGVLPFEADLFERAGLAEVQRTIREQEPAAPSTRLTLLGEKAKTIAASRGTQLVPLARRLHRELEWIPLKAMRKDRCRRYRSASEMADDIRNYLNGRPLIAGPETTTYRVQKFVRKHAGSVATVALVAATIVLGLVVSTVMYRRSESMRVQAEEAREKETVARTAAEKAERVAGEQRDLAEQRAGELRRTLYVYSIQLADAEYRDGNAHRVRGLLNACPSDLRGWEWDYLWSMSDRSLMTLRGHRSWVNSVAVSPDGRRIVSGDGSGEIKMWDSISGTELMTLRGHEARLGPVAFSPDGKRIVSGSRDKTVKVWDAVTGGELMTLHGHQSYVYSAAFSPDGKRIVSASHDGTIRVWDCATGAELMLLRGYEVAANSATYSADGKRIVSAGGWDGKIKIWNTATGTEMMTLQHGSGVWSLAISPDGTRVVSGGEDGIIKVWDTAGGKELMVLCGHKGEVTSVAFSPDGKRIASGSWDNTVRLWDASTGAELMVLRGHEGAVCDVVFTPDSERIVSGGADKTVRIWDGTSDSENMTINTRSMVDDLAFTPDGRYLVTAGEDAITIRDVETGAERMIFHGYDHRLGFGTLRPDDKHVVCWSRGSTQGKPVIDVWDMTTRTRIATLHGHEKSPNIVSFSQDGEHIVTGSSDDTIRIWDASNGAEVTTFRGHREGRGLNCAAFSPDGKSIATIGSDGVVKVWDWSTGTELTTVQHGDGTVHQGQGIWSVAFSPDGRRIVSGGTNDKVKVWDALTGAEIMALDVGEDGVISVTFTPDGRRVVACARLHAAIRVWDADTGTEAITLRPPGLPYMGLSIGPDGKTFAVACGTATYSNTVVLFESASPAGGYGPRRAAKAATKVVDALYEKYDSYRDLTEALRNDKTLDEPTRKVALQITDARKGEHAFKLYKEGRDALSSAPGDPNACRAALEKVEKANRLEPNNLGILGQLHLAQRLVGAYQEALKTCTTADFLDPNNPVILARLGWLQCRLGAYDDALKTLARANSLDPNQPAILNVLGMIHYRRGAYEDALKMLTMSNEILATAGKSQFPSARALTAMALHQLDRADEAKSTLEQLRALLTNEPSLGDPEAKALLAEAEGLIEGKKP